MHILFPTAVLFISPDSLCVSCSVLEIKQILYQLCRCLPSLQYMELIQMALLKALKKMYVRNSTATSLCRHHDLVYPQSVVSRSMEDYFLSLADRNVFLLMDKRLNTDRLFNRRPTTLKPMPRKLGNSYQKNLAHAVFGSLLEEQKMWLNLLKPNSCPYNYFFVLFCSAFLALLQHLVFFLWLFFFL